jgi:WD40 repeat protein
MGAVGLWEGTRRLRELTSEGCRYPSAAAFSPDGGLVAIGCDNGQVALWSTTGGMPESCWTVLNSRVEMVRFSADGKTILAGGTALGLVDLSKPPAQQQVRQVPVEGNRFALSGDGRLIAVTGYDGEVQVLRMPALTEVTRLSMPKSGSDPAEMVLALAFAPDGLLVTSCGSDVCQWDLTAGTGRPRQILHGHRGSVTGLAFAAGGKTLISSSADATLRFWSWPGGALRLTVSAVGGADGAYALSPNGMMETWADGERGLRCHAGAFAVPMKECRARFQRDGMLAAALGW